MVIVIIITIMDWIYIVLARHSGNSGSRKRTRREGGSDVGEFVVIAHDNLLEETYVRILAAGGEHVTRTPVCTSRHDSDVRL